VRGFRRDRSVELLDNAKLCFFQVILREFAGGNLSNASWNVESVERCGDRGRHGDRSVQRGTVGCSAPVGAALFADSAVQDRVVQRVAAIVSAGAWLCKYVIVLNASEVKATWEGIRRAWEITEGDVYSTFHGEKGCLSRFRSIHKSFLSQFPGTSLSSSQEPGWVHGK